MSNLLGQIAYLDLVTVQTANGQVTGRATSLNASTGNWCLRLEDDTAHFATATSDNVLAVDKSQPIEPPITRRDSYWDLQRDPIHHFGAY